jgi:hypothetical protein
MIFQEGRKSNEMLVELTRIELVTSRMPDRSISFNINNIQVYLQEIPTYSNLCNLQMQAKRKRGRRRFVPVSRLKESFNEPPTPHY